MAKQINYSLKDLSEAKQKKLLKGASVKSLSVAKQRELLKGTYLSDLSAERKSKELMKVAKKAATAYEELAGLLIDLGLSSGKDTSIKVIEWINKARAIATEPINAKLGGNVKKPVKKTAKKGKK